jgi:hypothetical protein
MDGENQGEDGRDYSKKEDRPDWRSKEAPEGDFDSLDPKPREFKAREFKPRSEYSERKSTRFESKEGGDDRPPRRERDSSGSEYKSREFKPGNTNPATKAVMPDLFPARNVNLIRMTEKVTGQTAMIATVNPIVLNAEKLKKLN